MTELWDWAVAVYERPGVADACLRLQDAHGQCVPLLLWAAWSGQTDQAVAAEAAAQARSWLQIIEPLRMLRRRLKTPVCRDDDAARLPLRERVKATELAAEQALMTGLAALTPDRVAGRAILPALLTVSTAWGGRVPVEVLAR
ncbi:MAG: TIGR02444 family protein, partial [Asticcacaulis sp.]|nr:TIGR02444 family protein [Asticcacaulis sp.]